MLRENGYRQFIKWFYLLNGADNLKVAVVYQTEIRKGLSSINALIWAWFTTFDEYKLIIVCIWNSCEVSVGLFGTISNDYLHGPLGTSYKAPQHWHIIHWALNERHSFEKNCSTTTKLVLTAPLELHGPLLASNFSRRKAKMVQHFFSSSVWFPPISNIYW